MSAPSRGVVVVDRCGTDASAHRGVASRLAMSHSVHTDNRPERGHSPTRPNGHGLDTKINRMKWILDLIGSSRVVGYSVGGYLALAGMRELPIERLALLDRMVNVDGTSTATTRPSSTGWTRRDSMNTLPLLSKGLRNLGSGWPEPIRRAAVHAVLLTSPGKTPSRLFPTVPAETRLASVAGGPASYWATVTAETHVFAGARSPDCHAPMAEVLVQAAPRSAPRPERDLGAVCRRPIVNIRDAWWR